MPHDMYGTLLKVGDRVLVPCVIEELQEGEEFCNITVKTEKPMKGNGSAIAMVLNTAQVQLVEG